MQDKGVEGLSVRQLLVQQASAIAELRRRKLCRSANNPIADLAEWLVAKGFDLDLAGNSTAGFDARCGVTGHKYEIKTRRISSVSRPTHLSVLRALEKHHFDYLVAVVFADNFSVFRASKLSFATVERLARFRDHIHGHLLYLRDIWSAEDVEDVTAQVADALESA